MLLMLLAFAIAVSMDGFGVGLTYGIRKIKIPPLSLLIIALVSSVMIGISMICGKLVATFISPEAANIGSALLLMGLGLWVLFKAWLEKKKNALAGEVAVFKWQIPSLGIAVQILCEPDIADADASGIISMWEAFYLGIALALDAFGAGLAMAMTGVSVVMTMFMVGLCNVIMISGGKLIGGLGSRESMSQKLALMPGIILLVLGIWKICWIGV